MRFRTLFAKNKRRARQLFSPSQLRQAIKTYALWLFKTIILSYVIGGQHSFGVGIALAGVLSFGQRTESRGGGAHRTMAHSLISTTSAKRG